VRVGCCADSDFDGCVCFDTVLLDLDSLRVPIVGLAVIDESGRFISLQSIANRTICVCSIKTCEIG
jgi:hypothetical protein